MQNDPVSDTTTNQTTLRNLKLVTAFRQLGGNIKTDKHTCVHIRPKNVVLFLWTRVKVFGKIHF